MTPIRQRRALLPAVLLLAIAAVAGACGAPPSAPSAPAAPVASGDPANGISIDNPTDMVVTIEYEHPDGTTETLTQVAPGANVVIDSIFADREGICRTGRLVAHGPDGAEIDELYLVCRGGTWTIEPTT